MQGLKQEGLAAALGEDWTQKKVSQLEAKETIEPELIEQVAKALKIPADAIKNLSEDAAINIISSTLHDTSIANHNHQPVFNFNPIDKWIQLLEENKKLYERLLDSERQKVEILQNQLAAKK